MSSNKINNMMPWNIKGRGRDRDTNSRTRGRVGEGMPEELGFHKLGQFIVNNYVILFLTFL